MPAKFNSTSFMKQAFQPRTADVEVAALAKWFNKIDEDQDGLVNFTVKGLSGQEMAKTYEAEENNSKLSLAAQVISGGDQNAIDNIRNQLGLYSDETPSELAKRLKMLELGLVEPKLSAQACIKLATNFPMEFYMLTHKITELTGWGYDIKK